ncbi:hypothetical protein LLB_1975 [Legionella longbeachae D-4968]|nr:hypothetical protein LLB_1975 [Legionella longbeachae D-4968]
MPVAILLKVYILSKISSNPRNFSKKVNFSLIKSLIIKGRKNLKN